MTSTAVQHNGPAQRCTVAIADAVNQSFDPPQRHTAAPGLSGVLPLRCRFARSIFDRKDEKAVIISEAGSETVPWTGPITGYIFRPEAYGKRKSRRSTPWNMAVGHEL